MRHTLHSTDDYGDPIINWLDEDSYPLKALHSVVIPALCQGMIPHGVNLASSTDSYPSFVMLMSSPEVLQSHNLLVQNGPVCDGDVYTIVFNISNEQLRIRKGEVISRLVKLPGAVWRVL